jgi:hypothetical protein
MIKLYYEKIIREVAHEDCGVLKFRGKLVEGYNYWIEIQIRITQSEKTEQKYKLKPEQKKRCVLDNLDDRGDLWGDCVKIRNSQSARQRLPGWKGLIFVG